DPAAGSRRVPPSRREEARSRGGARGRRIVLGVPRQGAPRRDADAEAGTRDRLLRQLQADPVLRAAELLTQETGPVRAHLPPASFLMKFHAHVDGAARGNPGPAGAGVHVTAEGELPEEEHFEALGTTTNNVAEYRALLLALRRAEERGATDVSIASDSLLLV